jgi:NAD(P)H dehydrogenase (quinone)
MDFDPVSDRRNFVTVASAGRLKQQEEEDYASRHAGFVLPLQTEMEKVSWCDVLILQFPLWWLGMPAILKGWIDRVFALGFAYGGGRYFGTGVFRGKRALCATTVGGSAAAYSDAGMYGPIEPILYPIHHGIFRFLGFGVLAPFVVYGPARMTEMDRAGALATYRERVLTLGSTPLFMEPDLAP